MSFVFCFNPRTYIRYDLGCSYKARGKTSFNPRTYIRYDDLFLLSFYLGGMFQSTYLYKVRPIGTILPLD